MDYYQSTYCECAHREFGGYNRAQVLRNKVKYAMKNRVELMQRSDSQGTHISYDSQDDAILKYRDMKPILQRTELFKDDNGNLAMSEECMHLLFKDMTRKTSTDYEGKI